MGQTTPIHVTAKIPTRIDLAGGTLDLWPIHQLLDHKATVNVGVTLSAQVTVTSAPDMNFHFKSDDLGRSFEGPWVRASEAAELPLFSLILKALWRQDLPPVAIRTSAKSPAGAGLGGSSCLGIALAAALWRARQQVEPGLPDLEEGRLVRTVQDIEARLIHAPTGCQDYWGGLRGRVNILTFPPGDIQVETLAPHRVPGLSEQLILCYSGKSRASAINNWEIFKRLFDGDRSLLAIFNDIGVLSSECAAAVRNGNLGLTLELSAREWGLRTRLWPNIETAETKRLDQAARAAGATFSRVCGAGGGGVMAIFAPPECRQAAESALIAAGGAVLPATVAAAGLTLN